MLKSKALVLDEATAFKVASTSPIAWITSVFDSDMHGSAFESWHGE